MDFLIPGLFKDQSHACSLSLVGGGDRSVVGLFAGVGGIELGLQRSGFRSELLCESWEPAQAVLRSRFAGADVVGDVRDLHSIPKVDLVSAGFPCTDLSLAGRMRGISGEASGLVGEVFRLLRQRRAPWVLLENVRNMLVLDGGEAMRFLVDEFESLGYRWAYRLVDSRFTGVPQRRQRVVFLASRTGDPAEVLFADDCGQPVTLTASPAVFGFYWTEGFRGLGWAQDAVPTLKGGSTIGIPSPPAIWNPAAVPGQRVVTPLIEEAEQLQGFPRCWTQPADEASMRKGTRWKLLGNAVSVGVSQWVGERLVSPAPVAVERRRLPANDPWPMGAAGARGERWAFRASMWPVARPYRHLADVVDLDVAPALSRRATAGFLSRARRSSLRFEPGFLEDVEDHVDRVPTT